jgi:hypothetical protein
MMVTGLLGSTARRRVNDAGCLPIQIGKHLLSIGLSEPEYRHAHPREPGCERKAGWIVLGKHLFWNW